MLCLTAEAQGRGVFFLENSASQRPGGETWNSSSMLYLYPNWIASWRLRSACLKWFAEAAYDTYEANAMRSTQLSTLKSVRCCGYRSARTRSNTFAAVLLMRDS